MPYPIPNYTALSTMARTDIQTALGKPLLRKSPLGYLADAEANMVYELYSYLSYIALQVTPYTATGEYLAAWAALIGCTRLPATVASGVALFTGTTGTPIPINTVLTTAAGNLYQTTVDWTVGSGVPLTFVSTTTGDGANDAIGVTISLQSPIVGVNSAGTTSQPIIGGTDQETDSSLRTRMLVAYANPPSGGSESDYVTWARQVPGVTRAWALPQGAGLGSVVVYFMHDGDGDGDDDDTVTAAFPQGTDGGASTEARITAATGDQLEVANWIAPLRPVTALVKVCSPTPVPINFVIQSLSPTNAAIEAAIVTALEDCLTRLGSPLAGNAIYPSDTNAAAESAAIATAAVNFRYTLISPTAPITVPVGSLPYANSVTFV